jgi:hypothetical protein
MSEDEKIAPAKLVEEAISDVRLLELVSVF